MASARRNRGLGVEPPAGSRAEPLVGGQWGGATPPEAESFSYIFIQKSDQKSRI